MISNQILQNTLDGLKGIARVELCVMDVDGKVVASTTDMGNCSKTAVEFVASPADSQVIQGYQYYKIYDEQQLEYVLVAGGTDTSSIQMSGAGCPAAAISIPSRFIHSGVEMIDLADLEATTALTLAYLRR